MKKCSDCGENKELSEFYKQEKVNAKGKRYIYYHPRCKKCDIKKSSEWIKSNPQKAKKNFKKYIHTTKGRKAQIRKSKKYRYSKRKQWEKNNSDKIKQYNQYRVMNKTHNISKEEWIACKEYFNNQCAYCGLPIEEHYITFKGQVRLGDFHKEHVDHDGANDLSNCVPACKECNCRKSTLSIGEWYTQENELINYDYNKLKKIYKWVNEDYKKYMGNINN